MPELLDVYNLSGAFLQTMDRDIYYQESLQEFIKTGQISRQVKTVRVMLMNSQGRLYVQKRSSSKDGNSGLYDKTVGGHAKSGTSYSLTVVQECAEELGIPAAVLPDEEFASAIQTVDLRTIAVLRQLRVVNAYLSRRKTKTGEYYMQPHLTAFYVGYFDGPIRFCDGEAVGILTFSLEELNAEVKSSPQLFTQDIHYILKEMSDVLKPLKIA